MNNNDIVNELGLTRIGVNPGKDLIKEAKSLERQLKLEMGKKEAILLFKDFSNMTEDECRDYIFYLKDELKDFVKSNKD